MITGQQAARARRASIEGDFESGQSSLTGIDAYATDGAIQMLR